MRFKPFKRYKSCNFKDFTHHTKENDSKWNAIQLQNVILHKCLWHNIKERLNRVDVCNNKRTKCSFYFENQSIDLFKQRIWGKYRDINWKKGFLSELLAFIFHCRGNFRNLYKQSISWSLNEEQIDLKDIFLNISKFQF